MSPTVKTRWYGRWERNETAHRHECRRGHWYEATKNYSDRRGSCACARSIQAAGPSPNVSTEAKGLGRCHKVSRHHLRVGYYARPNHVTSGIKDAKVVSNFEIRISKIRNNFKIRNKAQNSSPNRACLEHWVFLSFHIVSSFGFRAWNLPFSLAPFASLREIFRFFWLRLRRVRPLRRIIFQDESRNCQRRRSGYR